MKKTYTAPSLEITRFAMEDVLTDSVITGGGGTLHPGQSGNQLPGKPSGETPANPT